MRALALQRKALILLVPLALEVCIFPLEYSLAAPISRAEITVLPDGWVDVKVEMNLSGAEGRLSMEIDGEPSDLLALGDGLLLNYTLKDHTLTVDPMGSKHLTISYQTPSLTSKKGAVWNLTVNLNVSSIRIFLPKNSVILGMSAIPSSIDLEGDWMKVTLDTGHVWLAYRVKRSPLTPPIASGEVGTAAQGGSPNTNPNQKGVESTQSSTVTSGLEGTPKTSSGRLAGSSARGGSSDATGALGGKGREGEVGGGEGGDGGGGGNGLIYVLPLLLIAGLAALLMRKRRSNAEAVDELEARILEFLREKGGEAMQSDIFKAIDAPRSTIWRRLRRMEKEGKIRLYREGGYTVAKLSR